MLSGTTGFRRVLSGAAGAWLVLQGVAMATDVSVVGLRPGRSADVMIDGGPPLTLRPGDTTPEGVKLISVERDSVTVSVEGVILSLPLSAERGTSAAAATANSITLSADARGQFLSDGFINGRSVRFVVDTGATDTTLSEANARSIGLAYRDKQAVVVATASGLAKAWPVTLASVRLGDLTKKDVRAVVIESKSLPVVLLGTSFLNSFDMHRQGTKLVLMQRR